MLPAVKQHQPDAVIFLGDLQAQRPLHVELAEVMQMTEIHWVLGNHDTDSEADFDHLFESELADKNLHGRVVEVAPGVRVAGLAGIFREQVWHPDNEKPNYRTREEFVRLGGKGNRWRGSLSRRHRSTIFPEDFETLGKLRADILVSHEAPGPHRNGFEILDTLAITMGCGFLFHGHQHDNLDYSHSEFVRNTGIRVYGVGLRGITMLSIDDGVCSVVVPGELDAKRSYRQKDIE